MNGFLGQLGSGLWALAAFIVLLGVIITVHEWGHFFVARRCGVHVIRFSIGFGKPLWMRKGRDGTEYVVAAIPLGGFVRMLDEREGEVPPERLHEAFNRKPVSQRFAIVAAGPLVNLLFAVLVYWIVFVAGSQQMAPVIGRVDAGTLAATAGLAPGDEVIAIDGVAVRTWDDVPLRLVARVGESGEIRFRVRRPAVASEYDIAVPVDAFMHGAEDQNPSAMLGIAPWLPKVAPVVGEVLPEVATADGKVPGPASQAGLRKGDRIVAVNGEPVTEWAAWVDRVRASAGLALAVTVERDGAPLTLSVTPVRSEPGERGIGMVGIGMQPLVWPDAWPAEYVREIRYGPVDALGRALAETWDRSVLTVQSIVKMASGAMSVESVGGPISIAKGAGATASVGFDVFLKFMAFLSISIGILNLLPVPVLDGGHLVFYAYEAIRGRPVPEAVQSFLLQVGVVLLMGLMVLAFYNDFARLGE